MANKTDIDPDKVTWVSPQVLSRQQDRYVEDGQYRILDSVEIVSGPDGSAGHEVNHWGGLAVHVSVVSRTDDGVEVHDEHFEAYDGPEEDYKPRREETP